MILFFTDKSKEPADNIGSNKFQDFFAQGERQRYNSYFDGMCIQFLFFKFIMSFRTIKYVDWISRAIGETMQSMFFVYIIWLPFLGANALMIWFYMGDRIA